MASERIVEGTWKCRECSTEGILGRHKACPSCGAVREAGEASFDFSARAVATDAEAVSLAQAGKDWYCFYCGGSNRGDGQKCLVCGADRRETTASDAAAKRAAAPPPAPKSSWLNATGLGCLGLIVVCGGGLWWATSTTEEAAQVESVAWTREIKLERQEQETKTGWRSEMPSGAEAVRDCRNLERQPRRCEQRTRQVQCGTEEKCHTENLENGFAKEICDDVPKMCPEAYEDCSGPIRDDKCTFDVWTWREVDSHKASGADDPPRWPEGFQAGAREREQRHESYAVKVVAEGESLTWEPKSEAEFLKFHPKDSVTAVVDNLGSLQDLRPAP
jgi:hypothetical protein